MQPDGKSTRFHQRSKIRLPLRVRYREETDGEWTEKTLTEEVTICGAGFAISRPVEPQRLISLSLPMPKIFRLFNYNKELYDVWAVVSYVRLLEAADAAGQIKLSIGAALIGENPPPSFLANPKTLYDLKPVLRHQSFWDWREQPRRTGPYARSFESRYDIEVKLIIEVISEQGKITGSVEGATLNISESGAAIVADLQTECPRYVLVRDAEKKFSLLAAVRGVYKFDTKSFSRLHLEFISGKWIFD